MKDSYGRKIDYLRISVTDRCNLRCIYCMPEKGLKSVSHKDILTYEEIIRVAQIMASLGVSKIKLTGGEPLVRPNLPYLVKELKNTKGIVQVTITTNGVLLAENLDELMENGIDGINISLDSAQKESFQEITLKDDFDKVIKAIDKALDYPNANVKINTVPIQNVNEDQLIQLVNLAKDKNLSVRFIEMMPIGYGKQLGCLNEQQVREIIYPATGELVSVNEKLGNGPSRYYKGEVFNGNIGFISAISHEFCQDCNRIRLTSEGFLKTCLQYDVGVDLRELLRNGSSDQEIKTAIVTAVNNKPLQHQFTNNEKSECIESLTMSQIGG